MLTAATEASPVKDAAAVWHAEWLVTFGTLDTPVPEGARQWRGTRTLALSRVEGSDLRIAENARFVVVFTGVLGNTRELKLSGRGNLDSAGEAADLLLRLLVSEGETAFTRLRGSFAALVWDRERDTLLVVRDQVGLQPIFYARAADRWLFSASPDVLASQPGVSREIDAVALSEWLCGWFPAIEDTAYRDVKRVPPASVVQVSGIDAQVRRYWDPFPEGVPVDYLTEGELEQFEPMLTRAVSRTLEAGTPAIFLSGGVDSIAVATTATDVARANRTPTPLALSLVFPDEVTSEEVVQTGVASRLGLEQQLVAFHDAVGPRGLLHEALALSATWPQPMWNLWSPAYMSLARRARQAGRGVLLTGRGGDEWLTISPYLLADVLKRGNVAAAWRLIQMRRRSSNMTGVRDAARLLWLTAARPLASAALDRVAPAAWHRRRRRRLLTERPDWVAPDPAIRRAMEDRLDRWIEPARPVNGFYQREARLALRHPAITHDMEETQEFGRLHGMRMLHPFWDVDLIELAHRVPPDLLMKDGRSKWLLRRRLAEQIPGLGLETRAKVSAAHVFRDLMRDQAPAALEKLGGPQTLGRLGVVRPDELESSGQPRTLLGRWGGSGRLWTLLNLETWVRHRA